MIGYAIKNNNPYVYFLFEKNRNDKYWNNYSKLFKIWHNYNLIPTTPVQYKNVRSNYYYPSISCGVISLMS